jgi:hypothetical protein
VAGWWFTPGTAVSSINKSDCHDITEILLKVALSTIIWHKPTKKHIPNFLFKLRDRTFTF